MMTTESISHFHNVYGNQLYPRAAASCWRKGLEIVPKSQRRRRHSTWKWYSISHDTDFDKHQSLVLPGFFTASSIRNQAPHVAALPLCSLHFPPKQQPPAEPRSRGIAAGLPQSLQSCFFLPHVYIWDRKSSKDKAIYLPLLQFKLIWTITQKMTSLPQFIRLTLIALLLAAAVAMEMGERLFCWYRCIIKGHWDCLGQEIIFRIQLLRGWMLFHKNFLHDLTWLFLCHLKLKYGSHWLQAKSQKYLPSLWIPRAGCFFWVLQGYRTTKLWSLLPLVS